MSLRLNYLIIKNRNDFIVNKQQFKCLLCSNNRITIDDSALSFMDTKFNYSINCWGVEWKSKEETVIEFEIETKDETKIEILEKLDNLIQRIKSPCDERYVINTIWDDISIWYANKLYPDMVSIENLLRKIIYKFMIKIAGSAWFDSTLPNQVREAVSKVAEKNSIANNEMTSNQLYFADFIQLASFLFEPYPSKPNNPDLFTKMKQLENDETNIRKNISEIIDDFEPKSNWERYFSKKLHVDNLQDKWKSLYSYRNMVAHAKQLRKKDYDNAKSIIAELNQAFFECLEEIDSVKLSEKESERVQEVARTTVVNPHNKVQDIDYLKFITSINDSNYLKTATSIKPVLDNLLLTYNDYNLYNKYYSDLLNAAINNDEILNYKKENSAGETTEDKEKK